MILSKRFAWAVLASSLTWVAACGSEPPAPPASESTPASTAPASGIGRVFFVEPLDGAMVKSPVRLRFGIENFEISPVPPGEVQIARPGMGHHHVAVDAECLPPGSVIPKAAPWVHFGDGKNEIDMQLPPGKHTLALQIGDDKHTTLPGLCSTITVTVTE
jgi:hypothetical protein